MLNEKTEIELEGGIKAKEMPVNTKYECCNCGWVGTHQESGDKTLVVGSAWLLVCPKCNGKDFFKA